MGIFMVNGPGWVDYSFNLLVTLVALLVAVYDWKTNNRKDYLWVFLVGTFFWMGVEFVLHLAGIRMMPTREIFEIEIPLYLGLLLSGTSEAAYTAVIALFVADRFWLQKTKNWKEGVFGIYAIMLAMPLLSAAIEGIQIPNVGGDVLLGQVGSRRSMFDPLSIIFTATMSILVIIWMVKTNPEFRRRAFYMYLAMMLYMTIWTVTTVMAGTRWVEVGADPSWIRAAPLVEFGAHTFLVAVTEFAKFIPFFVMPCLVRLIKPPDKV